MCTNCRGAGAGHARRATRADAVVSVSDDLGDYLRDVMARVERHGDSERHRRRRLSSQAAASRQALRLFSISRLVPRKNIHVLIAAVEQLVSEGAADLAGHRRHRPEKERIDGSRQQSPGVVRFVGFIDEPRKRGLLSETDVFVQLSTREGLSIAALEALASGVPCVVSNIPGVREPITPGQTRAGTSTIPRTSRASSRRSERAGRPRPTGGDEADLPRRGLGAIFFAGDVRELLERLHRSGEGPSVSGGADADTRCSSPAPPASSDRRYAGG